MFVDDRRKRICPNAVCACTGWCFHTEEEWKKRQEWSDYFNKNTPTNKEDL